MSCVGSVGKSQSGVCRRTSISSFEWVWIGMQHPENHCEFGWDFQVPVYPPQRFSGNYGKQGLFSQDPWDASSLCRTCSSEVLGRFLKTKPWPRCVPGTSRWFHSFGTILPPWWRWPYIQKRIQFWYALCFLRLVRGHPRTLLIFILCPASLRKWRAESESTHMATAPAKILRPASTYWGIRWPLVSCLQPWKWNFTRKTGKGLRHSWILGVNGCNKCSRKASLTMGRLGAFLSWAWVVMLHS